MTLSLSTEPVERYRAVCCEVERITDFGLATELLARFPAKRSRMTPGSPGETGRLF